MLYLFKKKIYKSINIGIKVQISYIFSCISVHQIFKAWESGIRISHKEYFHELIIKEFNPDKEVIDCIFDNNNYKRSLFDLLVAIPFVAEQEAKKHYKAIGYEIINASEEQDYLEKIDFFIKKHDHVLSVQVKSTANTNYSTNHIIAQGIDKVYVYKLN